MTSKSETKLKYETYSAVSIVFHYLQVELNKNADGSNRKQKYLLFLSLLCKIKNESKIQKSEGKFLTISFLFKELYLPKILLKML